MVNVLKTNLVHIYDETNIVKRLDWKKMEILSCKKRQNGNK